MDSFERSRIVELLRMGCPRAAGAKYLGLTPEELEAEVARDETLAKEVLRAEGMAVLLHMGNVRKAANDEKNWRTSVWWLEQQARLDKASGPAGATLQEAVREALERFAELIVNEISDVERRQRVLTQLMNITTDCAGAIRPAQVIDVEPALLTATPSEEGTEECERGAEEGA